MFPLTRKLLPFIHCAARLVYVAFLALTLTCPLKAGTEPLMEVARELAEGIQRNGGGKAAVLALPHHDNQVSDGPFIVSERLTNCLVKTQQLVVVERSQIVQVLEELHLSETGVLDPNTVHLLGKTLGADVIVTGTLINLSNEQTEVNARGIRTRDGRVIAAGRSIIDRNWSSRRRLEW